MFFQERPNIIKIHLFITFNSLFENFKNTQTKTEFKFKSKQKKRTFG